MIFAHGPAGYLLSKSFFGKGWQQLLGKEKNILIASMIFFAIMPDLDFFYFYLINADTNHRNLLSHTPILYLGIGLLFWLVSFLRKNTRKKLFLRFLACSLVTGTIVGHLFLDSINAGVMWFWPFSERLYGIRAFKPEGLTFAGFSGQFFVLFLEIVIITCSGVFFVWQFFHQWKKEVLFLAAIFFLCSTSLLAYAQPSLYDGPFVFLEDNDHDGIQNSHDADIDDDGQPNTADNDSDGDGINNREDFLLSSQKLIGKWYDHNRGKFLNIPKNFGFLTNTDMVHYALVQTGIFLQQEMLNDFTAHPQRYLQIALNNSPQDNPYFYENIQNMLIYFENTGKVMKKVNSIAAGDIIFLFENERVTHIVIIYGVNPKTLELTLLEAHPDHKKSHLFTPQDLQNRGVYTGVIGVRMFEL